MNFQIFFQNNKKNDENLMKILCFKTNPCYDVAMTNLLCKRNFCEKF